MHNIYKINYPKFFALAWLPSISLASFGILNKGDKFFTWENFLNSRIFGENYFFLIFSFSVYFTWISILTLKVINSKGSLISKENDQYFLFRKKSFRDSDISSYSIEKKYFSNFLSIKLKSGDTKTIPLIFARCNSLAPFEKSLNAGP